MDKHEQGEELPLEMYSIEEDKIQTEYSESLYNSLRGILDKFKNDIDYYPIEDVTHTNSLRKAIYRLKTEGYKVVYIKRNKNTALFKIYTKKD